MALVGNKADLADQRVVKEEVGFLRNAAAVAGAC